ncbi:putative NADH-ubiquinone oxidoreductase, 21kDa subunit [Helianthus annuus]|uniref:NADH-ubiquinone oxidoreductase, 21kDa subunit n=1 Tax=Helianthus annuus TaxID=4232 RepID=A0A251RT72_HELAN|nr:putative NADH-ubiquinone oxidoreductase, 21kDa subunit [Helianthus annuus]KAJ0429524.1 putative NADH-ubiquinone oxidoreductase, 21kDa subunit [Helianthus annuus]KAJ0447912.1 putative NADH-ubiquinone oxidoreductase, 21kDa subunit [Helianthus annuus]KAJ0632809.1 putative NADH-ubiquinone oxidoreductase, 21kDa subunit [Helianthus annuus]KAJ0668074.1 putative NADH-ubiquinone oxidoreductase, 21kDa subunit [Helianthus annuus]
MKTVGNFNTLTTSGSPPSPASPSPSATSPVSNPKDLLFSPLFVGIKPGIRSPSMVTRGLIGVMGGFMYTYQNSAGRLMGFFPNNSEVARYKN